MGNSSSMFGSASGSNPMRSYPSQGQFNQSPQYNNASQYFNTRAGMMPSFVQRSFGQFGRNTTDPYGQNAGLTGGNGGPVGGGVGGNPGGDPGWVFGKGSHPVGPGQYGTRPMEMDQAIGSPPSAFGFDVQNPMPEQQENIQSLASPQQAPMPQAPKADAFANSMLYNNPWGFSQQQLGPSFNPMGSAQGGYFNGDRYVPHTGNSRNGLDRMARIGLNWNGQPFGKVGA